MHKNTYLSTKIFLGTLVATLCFGFFALHKSFATTQAITGWGWAEGWLDAQNPWSGSYSGNGVDNTGSHDSNAGAGWVSFNCSDGGATQNDICAQYNYGLQYNTATNNVTGKIWSDNIGWISFAVGGCPAGTASNCSPRLDLSTNKLVGWARATSAPQAGANTGGWDGWISLSDANDQILGNGNVTDTTTHIYGVTYNPADGSLTGYAWGDNVVGWLDFTDVKITQTPLDTLYLIPSQQPLASGTMLQNASNTISVPAGTNIFLNWDTHDGTVYDHCAATASPSVSAWSSVDFSVNSANLPTLDPAFKTASGIAVPANPTTYTLTCYPTAGASNPVVATAVVNTTAVPPPGALVLSRQGSQNTFSFTVPVAPNDTAALWYATTSDTDPLYTSCVGLKTDSTGTANLGGWDGNTEAVPHNYLQFVSHLDDMIAVPDPTTYFILRCTKPDTTYDYSNVVTVYRTIIGPYCTNTSALNYGGPLPCIFDGGTGGGPTANLFDICREEPNNTLSLHWTSTGSVSCTATSGAPEFSTGGSTMGTDTTIGTLAPSPNPYSYSIQCTALDGSTASDTASVWYVPELSGIKCSDVCPVGSECAAGAIIPIYNEPKNY